MAMFTKDSVRPSPLGQAKPKAKPPNSFTVGLGMLLFGVDGFPVEGFRKQRFTSRKTVNSNANDGS